jgi:hypothetical protein
VISTEEDGERYHGIGLTSLVVQIETDVSDRGTKNGLKPVHRRTNPRKFKTTSPLLPDETIGLPRKYFSDNPRAGKLHTDLLGEVGRFYLEHFCKGLQGKEEIGSIQGMFFVF